MCKLGALLKHQMFQWADLWPQFGVKGCVWRKWDTKLTMPYLTETGLHRDFILKGDSS
jgi:hypothetical protein